MKSKRVRDCYRWLWVVLWTVSVCIWSAAAHAACAVDESQSYFFGTISGAKFNPNHELRAYIEGVQVGSTHANPGRMEEVNGKIEFALYVCSPQNNYGKSVEFRFVRSGAGKNEFEVRVDEGDSTFVGRPIDFLGGIPDTPDSAELKLFATEKRVIIQAETDDQTDEGDQDSDGADGGEGDGGQPSGGGDQVVAANPDVNDDRVVDSIDAAIVLNYILFTPDSEPTPNLRYDINNDGVVNTEDVKEIYRRR